MCCCKNLFYYLIILFKLLGLIIIKAVNKKKLIQKTNKLKNRTKLYLSLIFFTLSFLPAQSQLTIFSQTSRHLKEINILESGDNILNEKIRNELKKTNQTENQKFIIKVEFTTYISVQRLDSFNIRIFAEVKDLEIKDKLIFRDFDISEFIQANCFSYSLSVFRNEINFNHLERNFYSENQTVENRFGYYTFVNEDIQTIDTYREFSMELNFIELCDSKNSNFGLFSSINSIIEYYEAENELTRLKNKLDNIDIEVIERILFNKIVLNDLKNEIEILENKPFTKSLNLEIQDPINFNQKINELKNEIFRKKARLETSSQKIEYLFYTKGKDERAKGKQKEARYNFEKSLEFKPNYTFSLCELADIEFENSNYLQALNYFKKTFRNQTLEENEQEKILKTWNKNKNKLNQFIDDKIKNQQFSEIQEITKTYKELCETANILNCDNQANLHIKNTLNGFYRSYLTVVEKAIEHKRFEIAKNYIELSAEYKRINSEYIEDNFEEEKLYEKLIEASINEIDNLLRQKRNDRAFETLNWTNELCKEKRVSKCNKLFITNRKTSTSIMQARLEIIEKDILASNFAQAQIRLQILYEMLKEFYDIKNEPEYKKAELIIEQHYYDLEIEEGLVLLQNEEYSKAFEKFKHAHQQQNKFGLKTHIKFDEYLKSTSIPLVNNELSNLFINIHTLSSQELEKESRRIEELISAFNLQKESSIIINFEKIEQELAQRRKSAETEKLKMLLTESEKLRKTLNFIASDSILKIVAEKIDYFYYSGIIEKEFEDTLSHYKKAVNWEYEYRLLKNLITIKKWENVLEQIESINLRIEKEELTEFGINKISLIEKLKQTKSEEFIEFSYNYHKKNENYEICLEITQLMSIKISNYFRIRKYQRELGVLLAKRDFEKESNSDFKQKVKNYKTNNKIFCNFSKAYLRTIRRSQNK